MTTRKLQLEKRPAPDALRLAGIEFEHRWQKPPDVSDDSWTEKKGGLGRWWHTRAEGLDVLSSLWETGYDHDGTSGNGEFPGNPDGEMALAVADLDALELPPDDEVVNRALAAQASATAVADGPQSDGKVAAPTGDDDGAADEFHNVHTSSDAR